MSSKSYDLFDPDPPAEETWIEYRGHRLLIDPQDYVGKRLYKLGVYRPEIAEAIIKHTSPETAAIDIGSHLGNYALAMRESVGRDGQVLAFEPHPTNAERIRKTVDENGYNNIEVFETAVSDRSDTVKLTTPKQDNTGMSTIESDKADNQASEIKVETATLDSVLSSMDIDRIGFVKIDVEGHERQVLAGMSDTLPLVDTILVEMHGFNSEDDRQAVVDTLSAHFDVGWSLLEDRELNSIDMESTQDVLQLLCSKEK